jgi:preprotein translocase subunit SecD
MRRVRLHHADAIIVQAETANNLPSTSLDRYYVLRNAPALTGADVRKPQAMLDEQSSVPIVQFTLTTDGQARFRALSAAVARRGQLRAHGGAPDFQHLGIVLDGRLVSVPYIDYNAYPDGVDASMGSEIAGGFTPRSAHVLAAVLAHGPLPVALSPAP